MKSNVVFFARDYQAVLFPKLKSGKYDSVYVTLTHRERIYIESLGLKVAGCFEDDFEILQPSNLPDDYLITSYVTDRYLGEYSLEERKLVLAKEKAFWEKIFESYKPIAVVNEVVAIEMAEVMYIEAKKRNIRYLAGLASPFDERNLFWAKSAIHSALDAEIFNNEPSIESIRFAKSYLQKFLDNDNVKPFYARRLKSRYNPLVFIRILLSFVLNLIRSLIIRPKIKYLRCYYFDRADGVRRIMNYINSFIYKYDNLNQHDKIVFYPLQYEPEASLLYMSEFNENQIGLIRNLAKCLKSNQALVVKEHPSQPGMLLSNKFRLLRKETSNLIYLPSEYSTKQLLLKSSLIITQTSTAGWEAILLGRPVVVLGKQYYDKYPYINTFNGFEKLKEAIRNDRLLYPDNDATVRYIAQMWENCREGNPFPNKNLYHEDNIKKIINAIEIELISGTIPD
ncbi:MAG: hypothetical protein L6455_08930 [Kiritimatiellae bacterium]|nr:hypothetical protein [Kiritimatiellia bacterium]